MQILQNTKKNLENKIKLKTPFPRISTRGYYDLSTGSTKKNSNYYLYPKRSFENLYGQKEICIMIHGLRNDKIGAVNKFKIAKRNLQNIGYKFPVIGFSYDSNTKGAHLKKTELRALRAGQKIAQKNGKNLSQFILDFKKKSPNTKFRLMGHSLGSQVILSTIDHLAKIPKNKNIIESVYFFGASIESNVPSSKQFSSKLQRIVKTKIMNYYAPTDEVLQYAHNENAVKNPLGLNGASGKPIQKYSQLRVRPENHIFKSYAKVLKSFP